MTTLQNLKVSVQDGKVTITADLTDKNYNHILIRRVTVGHLNPKNARHVRHVQISDQGVFVKWCGQGFCMELDDIVAIAAGINPKTSFAPVVGNIKNTYSANVVSELPATIQWEFSADKSVNKSTAWTAISGATASLLQTTPDMKGNWVRCTATNAVGTGVGFPILVK